MSCKTCKAFIGCRRWCKGLVPTYGNAHDECREDVLEARAEVERLRAALMRAGDLAYDYRAKEAWKVAQDALRMQSEGKRS